MDISSSNTAMWRGALVSSSVLGATALLISPIIEGKAGFFGSALAAFTVVIFFSVSMFVGRFTKNSTPTQTMALALFSYFAKLLFIGVFMIIVMRFTEDRTVSRTSFGLSSIVIVFGWLAGEVRAFFKLRLQLPLPERSNGESEGD